MVRPWLAIPIAGAIACALGALIGGVPVAIAMGLAAAATTAAGRALMGDSPAALAASIGAAMLCIATLDTVDVRAIVSIAALAWTLVELARVAPDASPVVAMLPAIVAGVTNATLMPLVPIAAYRLVTAPWKRPRWIIFVPIGGAIATAVAVLLCTSARGDLWAGRAIAPSRGIAAAELDALGPFVVVGALAGLRCIAGRGRYVQLALIAAIAGAVLGDLRAGTVGAPTVLLATLFTGLAIGRLAAGIRLPLGQAVVAAMIAAIVVTPPAFDLVRAAAH